MDNNFCCPNLEIDEKALYREMFNLHLRDKVQPNAGRIQQFGKETYCAAYASHDATRRKAMNFSTCLYYYDFNISGLPESAEAIESILHPGFLVKHWTSETDVVVVVAPKTMAFGGAYITYLDYPDVPPPARTKSRSDNFVDRANRLDKSGRTDAALDLIYDKIDEMLKAGKYSSVDSVLKEVKTKDVSVDLLLGLLTSTLPAKTKLHVRKKFFQTVELEIRRRGEWEAGLLTGLEN